MRVALTSRPSARVCVVPSSCTLHEACETMTAQATRPRAAMAVAAMAPFIGAWFEVVVTLTL